MTQKYLSLAGGIRVTIKTDSTSAGATTYSLTNLHSDIMATVNADGTITNKPLTGPFGEKIEGTLNPTNTADGATYNYLGSYKKTTDQDFAIAPTQMGARVYLADPGRFLQVDPVEGGTPNNYVYPTGPVNQRDVSGKWGFGWVSRALGFYAHWLQGTGRAIHSNIRSFKWSTKLKDMGIDVNKYKGSNGNHSVKSKNFSTQCGDNECKAIIGGATGDFYGNLTVKGNKWRLTGKMTVRPDSYDFNDRDGRTILGEISTRIGRAGATIFNICPLAGGGQCLSRPKDYMHYIDGALEIDESGTF